MKNEALKPAARRLAAYLNRTHGLRLAHGQALCAISAAFDGTDWHARNRAPSLHSQASKPSQAVEVVLAHSRQTMIPYVLDRIAGHLRGNAPVTLLWVGGPGGLRGIVHEMHEAEGRALLGGSVTLERQHEQSVLEVLRTAFPSGDVLPDGASTNRLEALKITPGMLLVVDETSQPTTGKFLMDDVVGLIRRAARSGAQVIVAAHGLDGCASALDAVETRLLLS